MLPRTVRCDSKGCLNRAHPTDCEVCYGLLCEDHCEAYVIDWAGRTDGELV